MSALRGNDRDGWAGAIRLGQISESCPLRSVSGRLAKEAGSDERQGGLFEKTVVCPLLILSAINLGIGNEHHFAMRVLRLTALATMTNEA
jgi:hypothetical protein